MKLLALCLCCLSVSCASVPFENWSRADTALELSFQTVNAIDYLQTKEIFSNSDYEELNPIMSEDSADLIMLGVAATHLVVSAWLNEDCRAIWQYVTLGVKGGIVINNYSIGIKP